MSPPVPPAPPVPPVHAAAAPPTERPASQPAQGDVTGGVIPYKNAPALVAYYAGVFSVIPFFPIGLGALALGIIGLRARKKNPAIRGAVHAWIGIIVGGGFGLLWLAVTVAVIVLRLT